ncbi:MAG: D-alanine--D-alanine ligase [Alphaproteobacteria bacterium]
MTKHVAVLMGGWSGEREISLVSGAAVSDALKSAGFRVTTIDMGRDIGGLLPRLLPRPDVVFNALHGRFGEDGCVQGLLELLNIPYTHSGVLASALAMNKPMAKTIFERAGISCPDGIVVPRAAMLAGDPMARPYVVKPLNEGSSLGVRIVTEKDESRPFEHASWPYGEDVLVEHYIPGREITVAVMGERALGALEIRPHQGFYDYEAKYSTDQSRAAAHIVPAPLPPPAYEEALRLALLAHRALGCRGVSRADFRYDDTGVAPDSEAWGRLYLLEINTQPGMTPRSLVPEIAAEANIPFRDLVVWMVENARCDS